MAPASPPFPLDGEGGRGARTYPGLVVKEFGSTRGRAIDSHCKPDTYASSCAVERVTSGFGEQCRVAYGVPWGEHSLDGRTAALSYFILPLLASGHRLTRAITSASRVTLDFCSVNKSPKAQSVHRMPE